MGPKVEPALREQLFADGRKRHELRREVVAALRSLGPAVHQGFDRAVFRHENPARAFRTREGRRVDGPRLTGHAPSSFRVDDLANDEPVVNHQEASATPGRLARRSCTRLPKRQEPLPVTGGKTLKAHVVRQHGAPRELPHATMAGSPCCARLTLDAVYTNGFVLIRRRLPIATRPASRHSGTK